MAVCQNLVPLVNIKIAGKWMFIPLKMVCIGIDQIHTHIWSFPFDPWFTHFFCLLRFDLLQPQVRRSKVTLEELEAGWMGWRSTATLVYYDILYVACIYIYIHCIYDMNICMYTVICIIVSILHNLSYIYIYEHTCICILSYDQKYGFRCALIILCP